MRPALGRGGGAASSDFLARGAGLAALAGREVFLAVGFFITSALELD